MFFGTIEKLLLFFGAYYNVGSGILRFKITCGLISLLFLGNDSDRLLFGAGKFSGSLFIGISRKALF